MRRNDGWCGGSAHGRYNCPIRLPSAAGHDSMWRDDHLYDIVGVLDWNFTPRIRGRGSAIFLHLCRPGFGPTAGCIALRRRRPEAPPRRRRPPPGIPGRRKASEAPARRQASISVFHVKQFL